MTYKNLYLFMGLFLMCALSQVHSQVGINTTTPRKALEVAGSMKISDSIEISQINALKDIDTSTFLIQDNQQFVKTLDVSNPIGEALGYIQVYLIENPNLDWVLDFDTKVNANDYVLNTISAHFNRELVMNTSDGRNSSVPYTSAFVRNGTWHIIADYPSAANKNSSEIGTWTITTLIYSKDLSKQFGTVNIPMNNGSNGSATTPIIN
ncbi:hypothetical protein [Aequorivita lipolytica]|uniref:Uncharacterized protein n=1 Tax=Aequorivita lipolytica TaxID=153267 RepID=A0A5C6YQB6_9FLAO|nr:hypothetical protein [Aequorivita lipolytica]TXD69138.1 hypothetical protein ESV24_08840 [Aequorivita lipolytica]SRX51283.1 hypothetical protein AEQU2_01763 [Aequorivita lipolytica]